MSELRIGQPVIINEIDRPYEGNIAIVVLIDDNHVSAEYLDIDYDDDYGSCHGDKHSVASLEDFGFELELSGIFYKVAQIGECKAKYPDGLPRKWQGTGRTYRARHEVLDIFLSGKS